MNQDPRLFVNPLLEASDFDSDAGQPMVLCVIPSANDPVRFAVPAPYMELVRQFDGERTEDEAIDAFLDLHPGDFEREWLRRLVRESLLRKGILVHSEQDPARVAASSQPKRAFLYLKLPVLPPSVVEPIARCLSVMFRSPAPLLGAVLFVVAHIYVYGVLLHEQHVDFNRLDASSVAVILLLSTLGTICHEFGHASAAAHYGCRRMSIGWGLYIFYTVLWTNVSEAWRLPRRQRAMIDIGGVYFESIFMLLLLALYVNTGNLVFLFAFIFIDVALLTTLNPFLRMDGYWLISDLFGIVNLRKQQTEWIGEIASKLFGAGTYVKRSSLSKRAKWALGIYSVAGMVFLAYFLTVILQFVVLNVADRYPDLVQDYWRNAVAGMSTLQLLAGFVEIFWRTMMLAGALFMLVLLATRVTRLVARIGLFKPAAQQSNV